MFYQRLRDLREDKDKLQKEIAEEFKTNVTQYRRYESGEREPPFEFIIKIAKYYNVSLDYIAGLTNDKNGFNKSDLPKKEVEMLKKFRSLSKERKVRVLERIDMLTEEQEEENAKIKDVI